ncbi:hypothetical protein Egran_02035 [Elaphomyces granulatus]|uniref:Peptidase M20 domain-containing protein 2 n=1 Tax=Elaphomyces granulatus TaxID=519963 RepID=A0A232M1B5_9EURO|nr:hypothetical protein Egran_02035 [Elaphomyces granulatus]
MTSLTASNSAEISIASAEETRIRGIIDASIAQVAEELKRVNRTIWENPELCYEEVIAHNTQVEFLKSRGFQVKPQSYGIKTSYEAEFGSGGRLVVFNAEYDALPFADPGPLHACGHNLIATSALVAFLGAAAVLKALAIPGRVRILGTPAEEGGAGKSKLLEAGAYKNVDACLMGHPAPQQIQGEGYTGTAGHRTIARAALKADFYGKPAHASGNPWDGINALDALVATYNNVSMLRQQIRPEQRIHAAFLKVPQVMNVIPDHTRVQFGTRSPTWSAANNLLERVTDCLKAGALASGCEIEYSRIDGYLDLRLNQTLCKRYTHHMESFGERIRCMTEEYMSASTDMGNVSYVVPGLHQFFGIPSPDDVGGHHPAFAKAAGTSEAYESAVRAGKGMAMVAWDVLTDDGIMKAVIDDFEMDKKSR